MNKTLLLGVVSIMLIGCSKITHDVYVVSSAKKVGIVQPGDSAFAAFWFSHSNNKGCIITCNFS